MALRTEKLFDEAVTVKGWRRLMAEADMNGSSFEKTAQDVHDLSSLMTKEVLEKQIEQLAASIEQAALKKLELEALVKKKELGSSVGGWLLCGSESSALEVSTHSFATDCIDIPYMPNTDELPVPFYLRGCFVCWGSIGVGSGTVIDHRSQPTGTQGIRRHCGCCCDLPTKVRRG